MKQTVNRPLAPTYGWLHMGAREIEVPEGGDRRQLVLSEGEVRTVVIEDSEAVYDIRAELAAGAHLCLIQLRGESAGSLVANHVEVRCADNARFDWYRIVLSGDETYDECKAFLEGEGSSFNAGIAYRLKGNEQYDANCEAIHTGKKTESAINASGVLSDSAFKLLRGTIDFRTGCSGAVGNEAEDVLLMDETVRNQSLPVILCAEEDVEGNHGATIGRPDEKLLHYMGSRGIDEDEACRLLAKAKLDAVIRRIPDEGLRARLLGETGGEEDDAEAAAEVPEDGSALSGGR